MSPVRVEREISQLQDNHADLLARCKALNASLVQRLALWRRFYAQLELVQQSVREADYMMEILAVQGTVDYERLVKATERLEVSGLYKCYIIYPIISNFICMCKYDIL